MESDTAHFDYHDSESGDIYDLFNACNGIVVQGGLLDVEQLNQYSPTEAKELNIPRLREIWEHTKTGCLLCRSIITKLHDLRGRVANIAVDVDSQNGPDTDTDPDINHISSIS